MPIKDRIPLWLPSLKGIVQDAGQAILQIYNSDDFGVEHKKDDSPLTKADQAANTVIVEGLNAIDDMIPIISEENKQIDYAERKHFDYCWMVDPLDGTKEFIKRNGEFTVNIALLHQGEPIFGIIQVPATGEIYWAIKGQGAYLDDLKNIRKLEAPSFKMSDKNLRIVGSRSHKNQETEDYLKAFDKPQFISKGSSLKLMLIAKGEADLYPRIAPTMEWDIAAGHCILNEAGGSVLRFPELKQPLAYNKQDLLNPYFVAFGKRQ